MKKTKFYQLIALVIVTILCHLFACKSDSNVPKTEMTALLNRPASIQYGKEWETVQNQYQDCVLKISKNPNDNEAKLQLAQIFTKEARVGGEHGHYYPAVLKILDEVIADEKVNKDLLFLALVNKAGAQLSQHDFKGALVTGNEALKLNNVNAQIYGVLVDANVELGNYEEAVKMSDKMISIKPDIRSYSRVAYLREIYGDVNGSIEAMKLAANAGYPGTEETSWAMLTLGNLLNEYNRKEEAIQVYSEILSARPDYPFALHALGQVYQQTEKLDSAEFYFKKSINIIPEVGFYISLAELYKSQNKTEEVTKLNSEILEMLKGDVESGHNMNLEYASFYLDLMNEPNEALKYANEEYKLRPENIDVNRLLAKINVALDMKAEARNFATAAGRTSSKNPELISIIAKL